MERIVSRNAIETLLRATAAAADQVAEVEYDPAANVTTSEGCEVQARRKRLGRGLPWVEEIKLSVPALRRESDDAIARARSARARGNA